jgi:hypothetical protein
MTLKGDWMAYMEKHADDAAEVADWLPVSSEGDWRYQSVQEAKTSLTESSRRPFKNARKIRGAIERSGKRLCLGSCDIKTDISVVHVLFSGR